MPSYIEVFDYLKVKNKIADMDADDLYQLLNSSTKKYNNLVLKKIVSREFIFLYDTSKNKNIYLPCVSSFYSEMKGKTCPIVRSELFGDDFLEKDCNHCHIKCIENKNNN